MRASKPCSPGGGRSRAPALHRRLHSGLRAGVLILGAPLIVAACGGDDDDANAGTTPPPVAMSCASMVGMALPDATITAATEVAAGPFVPTGTASYTVPAFCRLQGRSAPTSDSLINFEVWVPKATAWNGKVVVTGNGGYSPALSYGDMVAALGRGYATVGGDTGHQSADPNDLKFGIGHPEKIRDWGTRSIHAITQAAKPAITAVQGKTIARSYYQGCSTGGHQGYAEVQRYPADFDGVIAGAPGNNRTALNAGFMWQFLANHAQNDNTTPILTNAKIQLVTRQAVAACDAKDGVTDGVISDPRRCTPDVFNVASLQCTGADNANCLTAPQVSAMQKMYSGARNLRTGEQVYPGWPVGSESGWASYWGTTEPTRADYWRYWVFNDPNWNWWTFDFDQGMATARTTVGPLVDQLSTDVSAFKARGGKLLVYNGWADPVVNPIDTIAYFDRLAQAQGSPAQVASFARLFLVPGMGHCGGGTGTSTVDWLTALDTWVESGVAPDALPASRVANQVVNRTRPICAYPKEAKYSGTGSIDDAANFTCG
ncbi:tannase/feruloyl esterase family alpha/beta hydrolase [Pigmentiphaga litoralis]|uniref:Feruloyl esterase n=1 Tax=Pigmentiphaga litoralis TaxID=516702 RepID=A0A7Y9LP77_9BURK|nr:tannase/feruloyl esterase family alpha/beta hydrolase [Pigmentiphaga litoralis]NYE26487.1 feruloyl esterase [Pigmentiphaga litoralis]NYE85607.1 feruloyl esterase [Pigmentiphaga litoralis]